MCELYGFTGKKPKQLNRDLTEFFSHSNAHPDGWGLALMNGNRHLIRKRQCAAHQSSELRQILRSPIRSEKAIAHIRFATVGYDDYNNTHPFWAEDDSGRSWIFAHNGTVFEGGEKLSPYQISQKGTTDSERIFLLLLDRVNQALRKKGGALDADERFAVVDGLVRDISNRNKINLLIDDGSSFYVHTNERGTLYSQENANGVTFSTHPLGKAQWKPVPMMTTLAYQNGRLLRAGTPHHNEYIPDEEAIATLFLAYSGL